MLGKKGLMILGGSGTLGTALLKLFQKAKWLTLNLDYEESAFAQKNYILDPHKTVQDQLPQIHEIVKSFHEEYDAMINVAGVRIKDKFEDDDILKNMRHMFKAHAESELFLSHLAAHHIAPFGFMVYASDETVYSEGNPEMASYSLSKIGGMSIKMQMQMRYNIPLNCTCATILPSIIDSQKIRKENPSIDFLTLLPADKIASLVFMWSKGEKRPENNSFSRFIYKDGIITHEFI